jgi:hypothetical protein
MRLEGCKGRGGSFSGAVRFRAAINPALANISSNRAIERVTISRPAFGLLAIMLALEMLSLPPLFSVFISANQTLYFEWDSSWRGSCQQPGMLKCI